MPASEVVLPASFSRLYLHILRCRKYQMFLRDINLVVSVASEEQDEGQRRYRYRWSQYPQPFSLHGFDIQILFGITRNKWIYRVSNKYLKDCMYAHFFFFFFFLPFYRTKEIGSCDCYHSEKLRFIFDSTTGPMALIFMTSVYFFNHFRYSLRARSYRVFQRNYLFSFLSIDKFIFALPSPLLFFFSPLKPVHFAEIRHT